MPKFCAALALPLGCAFLWTGPARSQGRGPTEWVTDGGDAQRSAWVRSDPKISVPRLSQPGFALDWKIKLNQEPGVPAILDRYIGYRGFRALAFMGSASGEITAIDTDLGRVEWKKSLAGAKSLQIASEGCTGGMTANVTRPTALVLPATPTGRGAGGGRSQAAKSGVGAPGEGAVTIAEIAARNALAAGRAGLLPPPPVPGRGVPPGPNRNIAVVDALSSDGMFHSLYVSNGEEAVPPMPFVPAGSSAHGLIVVDTMAYAATSGSCGGAPNGIWALDLATKEVVHWTATGDLAGAAGFAFAPDGVVYAATSGGDLVSLEPKTLAVKATYHANNDAFVTSPLVFEYKGRMMVAAGTSNRIHLVDAVSLTGTSFAAAVSGELSSWQDPAGTRSILAPARDSIAAWKVGGEPDAPSLQPAWTSKEIASPLAPLVIDGVVFAVSNGSTAVLHAFNGANGKELWNSGKTITGHVRYSGISGGGAQVYIGAGDRTIYAFGFPIEH